MNKFLRFSILVTSLLLSLSIAAQEIPDSDDGSIDRKGRFWLDGNSASSTDGLSARGGYFLTNRLLVGGQIGEIDNPSFGAFARLYLSEVAQKWQPYAELGVNTYWNRSFGETSTTYGVNATLGLERSLKDQVLFNIELGYENFLNSSNSHRLSLVGNLNTTFGGPAGKAAAANYFKKGTFTVNNQLFAIGNNNFTFGEFYSANISPSVGLFLSDRLMLRGELFLGASNYTPENFFGSIDEDRRDFLNIDLDLGLRYYLTTNSLFNLYAHTGVEAEHLIFNAAASGNNQNGSQTQYRARLGIGTTVFINRSVSIDYQLGVFWDGSRSGNRALGLDTGKIGLNFWFD